MFNLPVVDLAEYSKGGMTLTIDDIVRVNRECVRQAEILEKREARDRMKLRAWFTAGLLYGKNNARQRARVARSVSICRDR